MKLNEVLGNHVTITGDSPINKFYAFDEIFRKINRTEYPKDTPFNVTGDIDFSNMDPGYTELPVKFGKIDGMFDCTGHKLKSLKNFPEYVGRGCIARNNNIESLVGIEKIIKHASWLSFDGNPIEEGGIGVLLIDGFSKITHSSNQAKGVESKEDFDRACQIINKYGGKGKAGLLHCQDELEDAGLGRFAKL